jgi:cobalt-zinc-cadmium efflux system protein
LRQREVIWAMPALSGHFYVNHDIDCHDACREVTAMLHDRFAVTRTAS